MSIAPEPIEDDDPEALAGEPVDDGWGDDPLGYHDPDVEPEPEGEL